jgi:predicted RNase H-like HicB family nuclease
MKFAVILEEGPESWGAYVPDLPGCIAVAETRAEVESLIREAILFHLEGLRAEGEPIPDPVSTVTIVEVPAA